jgi:hypothetical protein
VCADIVNVTALQQQYTDYTDHDMVIFVTARTYVACVVVQRSDRLLFAQQSILQRVDVGVCVRVSAKST